MTGSQLEDTTRVFGALWCSLLRAGVRLGLAAAILLLLWHMTWWW